MNSNKGITLTSLIIYVIVFCIVIGTVTTLSGYFTKNINDVVITANTAQQYTKLTTYLSEDLNSINLQNVEVDANTIKITFKDKLIKIYMYNDGKIYYIVAKNGDTEKKITLCSKIKECTFSYEIDKLKISVLIDGIYYNNNYTIKILQ